MGFFRKTLPIFLACLFVAFTLVSCSSAKEQNHLKVWMEKNGKIKVLATTAIVEDIVKEIGGEYADTIALITGELNPHSYELVKGDSEKFLYADLIFANGLLLEHSPSMQYQLHKHKNVLFVGDEILKKAPSRIIYIDKEVDPHIWMDLSLWAEGVDLIVEKFSSYDPLHKSSYLANGLKVKERLEEADLALQEDLRAIPLEKRYLVTSHDAFNYFVRRYLSSKEEQGGMWRTRLEALQGLAPDDQISALSIQNIVKYVEEHNVHVIFPEANLSQDSLHKVQEACQSRGVKIVIPKETLFGDTLEEGQSHIEMLQHNAHLLETYLGQEEVSYGR